MWFHASLTARRGGARRRGAVLAAAQASQRSQSAVPAHWGPRPLFTETFRYVGQATQEAVVPAGAAFVEVDIFGGRGGNDDVPLPDEIVRRLAQENAPWDLIAGIRPEDLEEPQRWSSYCTLSDGSAAAECAS